MQNPNKKVPEQLAKNMGNEEDTSGIKKVQTYKISLLR